MMNRATYRSKSGTERRMTFRCDHGIRQAHRFAEQWELVGARADTLQRVEWLRECERPIYELTLQGAV